MTLSLREAFDAVADLPTTQRHAIYREHAMGDEEIDQLERLVAANKEPLEVDEPLLDLERVLRKTPLAGSSLGRWRLLQPLGRGGMGVVWRAERTDGRVEQTVAIKLLDQPLDPTLQARIGLERSILARLDHPGIGRFIDAGEDDGGHPYFAMELIEGKSIDQWTDEKNSTVRERVRLVHQLLEALAHAHAQLVVHRDLKCSNVLVTHSGTPKLIDFGIARNLGNSSDTRAYGRFLTLRNAAPEQLLGHSVGTGVDIYGAGLVLYELLCGLHPFAGEYTRSGELEQRIIDECPQPPSRAIARLARNNVPHARDLASRRGLANPRALQAALYGDLDAIVGKALAKTSSDRYSTAEAFAADLRCWLDGHPVHVRRTSSWYRLRKFVGRHRLPVAAAAVFVIGLVVLSSFLWVARRNASEARSTAERTVEFLVGVFAAGDPEQNQGSPPTAVELLDRAVNQISQKDLTRVDASFSLAMAQSLLGLGQPRRALDVLPAKMDALLEEPMRLKVKLARARATLDSGDSRTALSQLRSLGLQTETSGDEELALQVRRAEVKALLGLDQRSEAMQAAQELLAKLGPANPAMPDWKLRLLADTLWMVSGGVSADTDGYQALEQVLLQLRQRFGDRHQDVATALRWLSQLDRRAARLDRARVRLAEAAAIISQIYGEQHLQTARLYNALANVESEAGNFSAALAGYVRALGIHELRLGNEHPHVAMIKLNMGMQKLFLKDVPGALEMLRAAESVANSRWNPKGTNFVVLNLALAAAELDGGLLDSAERRLHSSLELARKLSSKNLEAWANSELALLFQLRGQPERAANLLRIALPVMEQDRQYFGEFLNRASRLQSHMGDAVN